MMPNQGDKNIAALDEFWEPVACRFHQGLTVLESETHDIESDMGKTTVEIPTKRSENVGHQPDCRDCQIAVFETQQHIEVVRADRARAEFEQRMKQ